MLKNLRHLYLFGTVLSVGLLPIAAQAQSADPAPAEEDDAGEIVVTAQRRSEALSRTPVAVSVITADSLARQAITSERDLQFAAPGLTIKATANDNSFNFSLRGQTVDTYTSSLPAVLPYVNEVQVGGSSSTVFYDVQSVQVLKGPQGTLFGRNATGGAVLFTTAKPTSELSGYGSVRYGRFNDVQLEGAVSGPLVEDKVLVRVAGVYRNRDGYQYNRYYDTMLGNIDKLGLRGSVTFNPDGPITNELVVDYYKAKGSNISGFASYALPVESYAAGYPVVPSALIPVFDDPETEDVNEFIDFVAAQKDRGPYEVDLDSLSVHRKRSWAISNITTIELGSNAKLKNIFGYNSSNYFDAQDLDGTRFGIDGRGNEDTGAFGGEGQARQFSDELQVLGQAFANRLDYVVGAYYSHSRDHLVNTSFIVNDLGAPPQINAGTTTSEMVAGYAQGTFDTGFAGFKVTGGLRYTSERVSFDRDAVDAFSSAQPQWEEQYEAGQFVPQEDTFKKLSWTVGLQNQVTSELLLYASARRSFRSGGFNFHAPPTPGFADTSGGGFRPEVATDIELGAKFSGALGGMPVRANVAVYNMWVDDIQRAYYTAIYGSLAGITVNVPKAEVTGFEFDASIRPTEWLTLGGTLNHTDARFTQNQVRVLNVGEDPTDPDAVFGIASFDTYPDTPRWSGSLYADIVVPATKGWDLTLHGDAYFQTSNYFTSTGLSTNPGAKIDGYTLTNFRIGLEEQGGRGLSVSALVKNAFNKQYSTGGIAFASLFGVNWEIPSEPRVYMLEARYKF